MVQLPSGRCCLANHFSPAATAASVLSLPPPSLSNSCRIGPVRPWRLPGVSFRRAGLKVRGGFFAVATFGVGGGTGSAGGGIGFGSLVVTALSAGGGTGTPGFGSLVVTAL